MLGREFEQTMEFRFHGDRLVQKQIAGRFKKWEAEWHLMPSDEGGTVMSMSLDIDFGFLGLFVSARTVSDAVDDWFTQLAAAAEKRLAPRLPRRAPAALDGPPAADDGEVLLQVFQTVDGLEIWIGKQRYFIPASPP